MNENIPELQYMLLPLQKFDDCIAFLTERLKQPLPGVHAQLKLAPPFRNQLMPAALDNYHSGSVMLLIKNEGGIPHLLFIERSRDGKVHSGQIAFPGGKKDKTDATMEHTALRETEEEIGWPSKKTGVLGALTELYIPPSNFMVHPFVGYPLSHMDYLISEKEVQRVIEIPLSDFFAKEVLTEGEVVTNYQGAVRVPCFQLHDIMIWGASGMILSEFLALFKKEISSARGNVSFSAGLD